MNTVKEFLMRQLGMKLCVDECCAQIADLMINPECFEEYAGPALKKEAEEVCDLLNKPELNTKVQKMLVEFLNQEVQAIPFESTPLKSISLEQSIKNQYRFVDILHRHFDGYEALEAGDYGCVLGLGRPRRTAKAEKVIAEYFHAEDCILLRGAGTGAIRAILFATVERGTKVLVHDASMYVTTQISMEGLGAEIIKADFNNFTQVEQALKKGVDMVYIQRTRQAMTDCYDTIELIEFIRHIAPDVKVVVDENYAVFKVEQLGCEAGADLSTFSCFKVMGIPGVGCVVGKKKLIDKLREHNYSGGGQVQGPEASEILRSLVNVHALLGTQNLAVEETARRLNADEVQHVRKAVKANIEERILLVQLDLPIAKQVMEHAAKLGALPYPVGSESRFEVHTMFYRVSRTMMEKDPVFANYVIRINPMRAGADTVLRILDQSIKAVLSE